MAIEIATFTVPKNKYYSLPVDIKKYIKFRNQLRKFYNKSSVKNPLFKTVTNNLQYIIQYGFKNFKHNWSLLWG